MGKGKAVAALLLAQWQSHFNAYPNQTLVEYRIDWTTIRNNSEGIGKDVGLSTVHKYVNQFRIELNGYGRIPQTTTKEFKAPVAIAPITIDSIVEARSQVVKLIFDAKANLIELQDIEAALDYAEAMAKDNELFSRLESENLRLAKDVNEQRERANLAQENAAAERELRIRQGETHSGSTR